MQLNLGIKDSIAHAKTKPFTILKGIIYFMIGENSIGLYTIANFWLGVGYSPQKKHEEKDEILNQIHRM